MIRPNKGAILANRELDRVFRGSRVRREARLAGMREVREMVVVRMEKQRGSYVRFAEFRECENIIEDIDALIAKEER